MHLCRYPIGMLSDSWGARKTTTLFSLIACVGITLFALSPTFGSAVFSRLLIGLGVSAVFVPAMKVYVAWFPGPEYGRAAGLFIGVGAAGWIMGTAPLAFLTSAFDWRVVFLFIGILSFLLTIITWLIVRDAPEKNNVSLPVEKKVTEISGEKGESGFITIFTDKNYWPLASWTFLRTGLIFCFFGLWAGPYLMDVYKLSKTYAGNVLSLFPLAIIVGSPFLGYVSDKLLESRKKVIVGTSIGHAACWLLMLFLYDSMPLVVICVVFVLLGIFAGSPANIGFAAVKELFPVRMAGTAIGGQNLAAFFGSAVFQPLAGYVLDLSGKVNAHYPPSAYRNIFLIFFVLAVVALVAGALSKETFR